MWKRRALPAHSAPLIIDRFCRRRSREAADLDAHVLERLHLVLRQEATELQLATSTRALRHQTGRLRRKAVPSLAETFRRQCVKVHVPELPHVFPVLQWP